MRKTWPSPKFVSPGHHKSPRPIAMESDANPIRMNSNAVSWITLCSRDRKPRCGQVREPASVHGSPPSHCLVCAGILRCGHDPRPLLICGQQVSCSLRTRRSWGGSPNCYGASATRRRNSGQRKTHHRPRRWPLARGPIFEPWSPREERVGACGRRH